MKEVKIFMLPGCPHCQKFLNEFNQYTFGSDVSIEIIDESEKPEIAEKYNYFFVPTLFLNDKKLHEGKVLDDSVQKVIAEINK